MHKVIAICFLVLISMSVEAQRNGNSPYSRFGIGDIVDPSFMHLKQMGSISSSYVDKYHVNIDNPASYAFLSMTAFEIGVEAKRSVLKENEVNSEPIWSGNLNYLSLAFPLQNDLNQLLDRKVSPSSWGMGFTLAPSSNVAYNIQSTTDDPIDGEIVRSYTGKGGSYKFLWGTAYKYKNFAVGTNLGYQFGSINYERSVLFEDVLFAYDDIFTAKYNMSGFLWDMGLIYTLVINKKKQKENKGIATKLLTFGLTYKNQTNLSTSADIIQIARQRGVGAVDTGLIVLDQEGKALLPSSVGMGVSYRHGSKFMIGIDYKTAAWKNYFNEATNEVKEKLKNTSTVSMGGYYRPNYKSYTSYWNRAFYRFGFYTKTEPIEIEGKQISTQAVTLGLGLPFVFQRKVSQASLGIEIGRRGSGSLIEEKFCNFTMGFTFNDDEWFLKRKYK